MDVKPAVKSIEVPGMISITDPRDYFRAADLKVPLLSGIAGESGGIGSPTR